MKLIFIFIFAQLLSVYAQSSGIPTRYQDDPAVDLTYQGKLLHPDEVHELATRNRMRVDISTLNPTDSSDLWKDTYILHPAPLPEDNIPIQEMDEVTYHSPVTSTTGIFRFNVLNQGKDRKFYTLMLSKTIHTYLLLKSVLRKIGYQIPDIKYLPKITLAFKNEKEKKNFISYLDNVAFAGNPQAWIAEDLGDKLILQDLVAMDSNHSIYNLAFGITPEMIQGRRLLSSLAIPLGIVNLSESINLMSWHGAHVANKNLILDLDNLNEFQCSWDDARWIGRRLARLSRDDWKQIVSSSHTPAPVQQLLLEKILSRRNVILDLLKIDHMPMPVNTEVSNGVVLVKGKLTEQNWPGYASRFAYGDPDSPVSDSDMKSWIKSRAISTAMELGVGQINQLPLLGTDIAKINRDNFQKYLSDALALAEANQEPVELPLKSWVFPTFRGQLILNRNLVTGTFLGTDNLVQLVDSVGVTLSPGLFLGVVGAKIPNFRKGNALALPISGASQAVLVRTWSHLRPVINIKKSLKYPFKNIFVPLVKNDYGKNLHEAISLELDPDVSAEEREAKIQSALGPLKEAMNVGESLLVTDSFVSTVGGRVQADLAKKLLTASVGVNASFQVISRFHVHRRSENEFQVYRDLGHKGTVGVEFNLDSLIPVLSLSTRSAQGKARVTFYNLNLDPKNPRALENASLLRSAIVHSSTRQMEEKNILPYQLNYRFKEKTPRINLLFWQFLRQGSSNYITVKNPRGEERYLSRHFLGASRGRNYQSYVNAMINNWVTLLWKKDAALSDATGANPGYSFKGSAMTRYLTLDEELDKEGKGLESFITLNRSWNGWSLNKAAAMKLLEEIKQRYKFIFYPPEVLATTHKIYLYNIGVTMLFYSQGIDHLLNLNDEEIKRIFKRHRTQDSLAINPEVLEKPLSAADDNTLATRFIKHLADYRELIKEDQADKAKKKLLRALALMEKKIYLAGIVELMGGDENLYVSSRIVGFREGDEAGDRPIFSNSLGDYGAPKILGPVIQVQRATNMLEGEFFINWMMQRLI
jgi:hypothetical protein